MCVVKVPTTNGKVASNAERT